MGNLRNVSRAIPAGEVTPIVADLHASHAVLAVVVGVHFLIRIIGVRQINVADEAEFWIHVDNFQKLGTEDVPLDAAVVKIPRTDRVIA